MQLLSQSSFCVKGSRYVSWQYSIFPRRLCKILWSFGCLQRLTLKHFKTHLSFKNNDFTKVITNFQTNPKNVTFLLHQFRIHHYGHFSGQWVQTRILHPSQLSRVTCHVSHVTCHMSHIFFIYFFIKWWSQSMEGMFLTEPTPYSLSTDILDIRKMSGPQDLHET